MQTCTEQEVAHRHHDARPLHRGQQRPRRVGSQPHPDDPRDVVASRLHRSAALQGRQRRYQSGMIVCSSNGTIKLI